MTRQQFARNYRNAVSLLITLIADTDTQIDQDHAYFVSMGYLTPAYRCASCRTFSRSYLVVERRMLAK